MREFLNVLEFVIVEMDHFEMLINCLKKFNYPLILSMSDDEVLNLFHISNREFFIKWIFEKIDSEFTSFLNNEDNLADLLYGQGFCSSKFEAVKFIKGELGQHLELNILMQMIHFLDSLHEAKIKNLDQTVYPPFELETIVHSDTNLFGGVKKKLNESTRQTRINNYLKEITHLEKQIDSSNLDHDETVIDLDDQIATAMNTFLENLSKFSEKCSTMMYIKEQKENYTNASGLELNDQKIKRNSENVKSLSNHLADVDYIGKFSKNNSVESVKIHSIIKLMGECAELLY